jgi:hypothetical protein
MQHHRRGDRSVTKIKLWPFVLVALVALGLTAGPEWWQSAGRDESRHQTTVRFDANWAVHSGDINKQVRTDSAAIVWHAGEHMHNQVHYGGKAGVGKYRGSVTLGQGTYVISLNVRVDADTETTCKIRVGSKGSYPNRSATGVCHVSITITVT